MEQVKHSWRLVDKPWIKAQFQWEPKQLWLGFIWTIREDVLEAVAFLHIMICFMPLVPLHITILLKKVKNERLGV